MDEQPWWAVEQLPLVARAYAEAAELGMERSRLEAERKARS